jgi:predicted RND superfamily exporter protein
LQRIEIYTGTLVSLDGKSTAIFIGTPADCDRTQLYTQIKKMITAKQPVPEEIAVTGAPVAESLLGIHILQDLGIPQRLLDPSIQTQADQATLKTPVNFHQLKLFVARRVGLVPVTMVVMVLVLLLGFRNPLAAAVPLPGIVATLVSVFGLMGWAGVPIYLTSVVMPVLLVATGATNDIYLFTRYFNLLHENLGKSRVELLGETFEKLTFAVAITSLATGIGFFSFAFSPLAPVSAFGVWAGVGVLLGLFYSLFVVPAILSLIPANWLLLRRDPERRVTFLRLGAFFENVGRSAAHKWWLVIACIFVVVALTPLGLRRLVVQDSWTDEFDPDSEFWHATQLVNTNFYGMHLLFICVDASETAMGELEAPPNTLNRILLPGDICNDLQEIEGSPITLSATPVNATVSRKWHSQIRLLRRTDTNILAYVVPTADSDGFTHDIGDAKVHFEVMVRSQLKPDIVDANRNLAVFLRQQRDCAVGGVIGPYEYLTTTRFMTRPSSPTARELTPLAGQNRALWDYYKFALGQNRFQQIMDTNYSRSLTTVFLKDANFVDTARLMSNIHAYEREHLAPIGIKLGFAGDVAVSQSLIHGVVTTQLQSLCW